MSDRLQGETERAGIMGVQVESSPCRINGLDFSAKPVCDERFSGPRDAVK